MSRPVLAGQASDGVLKLTKIGASGGDVDVSGDGPNNDGYSLQELHDKIVNNGITVNGLGRVQLFVPKEQAAQAREILAAYNTPPDR